MPPIVLKRGFLFRKNTFTFLELQIEDHLSTSVPSFKEEYILGNQRATQEAVARGDDVQGNF